MTHVQGHQNWVVPCRGASQQEQEADGAPYAEHDEDDGDEGELPVCHGRQRVRDGAAGQDGTVLRKGCMLKNITERIKRAQNEVL